MSNANDELAITVKNRTRNITGTTKTHSKHRTTISQGSPASTNRKSFSCTMELQLLLFHFNFSKTVAVLQGQYYFTFVAIENNLSHRKKLKF